MSYYNRKLIKSTWLAAATFIMSGAVLGFWVFFKFVALIYGWAAEAMSRM